MTRLTRTLLLIAVLSAGGCAAPLPQIDYYDVETDALRKLRNMSIIDEAGRAQGAYRELGEVKGLYCNRNRAEISPERSAIDQLKISAAQKGADRIGTPSCETRTTWDLTNNCFMTVTCRAEALAVGT